MIKEFIKNNVKAVVVVTIVLAFFSVVGVKALYNSVEEYKTLSPEESALKVSEAEEKIANAELKTLLAGLDAVEGGEMAMGVSLSLNTQSGSYTDGADLRQNVQAMAEQMAGLQSGDMLQVNSRGYMVAVSTTALQGDWKINNPVFSSTVLSTSTNTETTGAFTQANLSSYDYIEVAIGSASGMAYNFPASSTLTTLLPDAGDKQEWIIRNTTTTAGVDLELVSGVGTYIEKATSTISSAIFASSTGKVLCIRGVDTDVNCMVGYYAN